MELSIEIKNYFNKIQIKKRIRWSRNKDQDECDGAKQKAITIKNIIF